MPDDGYTPRHSRKGELTQSVLTRLNLRPRDVLVLLGLAILAFGIILFAAFGGGSSGTTAPQAEAGAAVSTTSAAAEQSIAPRPLPTSSTGEPPPVTATSTVNAEVAAPMAAEGVDTDVAPAPGMIAKFAPPDGPAPDVGPYQIDPQAMRKEFESHGVTTSDEQLEKLVAATNTKIAKGEPDLKVWDVDVRQAVRTIYPDLPRELQVDVQRCAAEYVERVIARNMGWKAPPDSDDDHDVPLEGRGPQARVDVPTRGPGAPATR